jgi:hypothetical protein
MEEVITVIRRYASPTGGLLEDFTNSMYPGKTFTRPLMPGSEKLEAGAARQKAEKAQEEADWKKRQKYWRDKLKDFHKKRYAEEHPENPTGEYYLPTINEALQGIIKPEADAMYADYVKQSKEINKRMRDIERCRKKMGL